MRNFPQKSRKRLLVRDQEAVYHVLSRTACKAMLFGPREKEMFCNLMFQQARFAQQQIQTVGCRRVWCDQMAPQEEPAIEPCHDREWQHEAQRAEHVDHPLGAVFRPRIEQVNADVTALNECVAHTKADDQGIEKL